jgi:hypothetical protein
MDANTPRQRFSPLKFYECVLTGQLEKLVSGSKDMQAQQEARLARGVFILLMDEVRKLGGSNDPRQA